MSKQVNEDGTLLPSRFPQVFVVARCVGCGHKQKVAAGEVADGDVPMCEECFSPMVAENAGVKGNYA